MKNTSARRPAGPGAAYEKGREGAAARGTRVYHAGRLGAHFENKEAALYDPQEKSSLPRGHVIYKHVLLPRPDTRTGSDISVLLGKALDAVSPLKKAHRVELPLNIIRLSRLLTVDRAEMRHPYWASPALTGAYVHYFLPWNVYRLSRLFAGLKLQPPADDRALVLDLGSGPLTVPLALWLAYPGWRARKLVVAATDCAGHPLQIGRALLENLARQAGVEPWEVHLIQAPLEQGLRKAGQLLQKGVKPWLVTAANVLNELPQPRHRRMEDEDEGERDNSRFADILAGVSALLRRGPEGARALFIEPGTRLGGLTLMGLRALARDEELRVEGPCPHNGLCPLYRGDAMEDEYGDEFGDVDDLDLDFGDEAATDGARGQRGAVSKLAGRSWCHFTFTSEGAPGWLRALAEPTGLAKETLSLAWLMLSRSADNEDNEKQRGEKHEETHEDRHDALRLRVISQPFQVPGRRGQCRYACSGHGLILLEDAQAFHSGTELVLRLSDEDVASAPEDTRSGARCLAAQGDHAQRDAGLARPAYGQRPGKDRGPDRRSDSRADRRGDDRRSLGWNTSRSDSDRRSRGEKRRDSDARVSRETRGQRGRRER